MSDPVSEHVAGLATEQPVDPRNSEGPVPETGMNNPRKVIIIPVENGFIVEIGCKRFVSEGWKKVADGLGEYFKDPEVATKKFLKK